jgi:hypothetical protein
MPATMHDASINLVNSETLASLGLMIWISVAVARQSFKLK